MAKEEKKQRPKAISLSAGELVALMIDEAGETRTTIAQRTEIDLSAISRFLSGQRLANERDYRSLASMAISLKLAE